MSDRYQPAPIPDRPTLSRLRDTAAECRACDLWEPATWPILRMRGPADRDDAMDAFVADLRRVESWLTTA